MFLTGWQISWCQGIRGGSFRYWWHSIWCYLRGWSFQRIRSGIWWHCSFQEGKFYELESDQNEIGFFHLWMKVVFKWSMRRSLFSSTVWWRTQQLWGSYYCWSCVQICVLQPSANGCWIHPRGIYLDFTLIMNRKGTHFLFCVILYAMIWSFFLSFILSIVLERPEDLWRWSEEPHSAFRQEDWQRLWYQTEWLQRSSQRL